MLARSEPDGGGEVSSGGLQTRPRASLILLHYVMIRLAFCRRLPIFQAMFRSAPYLSLKLTRPLRTKDDIEAISGRSLLFRPLARLAQDEEPGLRRDKAGGRRGLGTVTTLTLKRALIGQWAGCWPGVCVNHGRARREL
jgi:hypothetical protein